MRKIASDSLYLMNQFLALLVPRFASNDASPHTPLFIVGLPRSGTTLLYQSLVSQFEIGFLHNHFNYLYGIPVRLGRRNRSTTSLESNYGHVRGWHSPSEHFGIWRPVFGDNVSTGEIADSNSLSEPKVRCLQNVIYSLQNRSDNSYLFKCLYLNLCITSLAQIFPRSAFIHLQREPDAVRRSMITGRSKHGENEWWSVKVPGWQEQLGQPIENQVDHQLSGLSRVIEDQLLQLESQRVLKLRYEELRSDIDTCIEQLSPWMNQHNIQRRADAGTLSEFVK